MVKTLKHASISIEEVLASKLRLEASVFNVEARKAKEVLKLCKWDIVQLWSNNGLIKTAFYPGRFKRIYVEKGNGYPMLLPSQMRELKPQATKFISKKTFNQIGNLQVKKDSLLMTRSGTIGVCTIVSKWLDGLTMSDDIIRVNFKSENDLGFVYTYLLTKVGKSILATNNYGSVIKHIEPEHLENVPIPNPSYELKQKIHNLIMDSFELRDKANSLIDKAEGLLANELKLPQIGSLQPEYFDRKAKVRTFSVKLELLNNRLEASYHDPIVLSILDCFLDNAETIKPLGDKMLTNRIYIPGRFKRVYLTDDEYGVPFFSGKCIYELDPSNKKYISKSIHSDRIGKELTIKENMILITCSGTTGKTSLVPSHWDNWVMTHDIVRVIPNNNEIVGYLSIFLGSDFGRILLQRANYGAVVPHLEVEHVEATPIPILKNKEIMEEINDLALEANKLRTKAYYKEQKAIQTMNEEVIYAT